MNSGVPWLHCTAIGWREQALKHAYWITLGKMLQNAPTSANDVEVYYLKAQNVQWGRVDLADLPTMWASPEEVASLRVTVGDLLVCEGGEVGRAAIIQHEPDSPTIIQNALHLVRGRNGSDTRFLLYVLRQAAEKGWIRATCNTSTISHFTVEKFREMRAWLPDAVQQRAIADYLERETARIDEVSQQIGHAMSLLGEGRTALIEAAVSGRIDVDTATAGMPK